MNKTPKKTLPFTSPTTAVIFMSILGALMAFTSLSTDIYLPAMPIMAQDLQGDAELTVTGFLIGFAIAQLIWGPISDHIGRKIPLFIGMVLFVVGSVGCALSYNIEQIIFWRVFQALGACTGPMLARAMIRDLFTRTKAAQMLSTLVIIMAIAPIVGPLLGGQMIKFSSWHSIFWLLAVIGTIMFFLLFFLPETLTEENRTTASLSSTFSNYLELLKNLPFMRYTLSLTFYYVAAYAFITGSPFVYINYYGITPQHYGWLFAVNIVGVMGISFINRHLVQHFDLDSLLKVTTFIATISILVMTFAVKLNIGGVWMIILPVFVFFSMNGIIAASSTAAALDEIPRNAGSASAIIGSLQYGSGIISTILLSMFRSNSPWTMTWIMMLFTLLSSLLLRVKSKKK